MNNRVAAIALCCVFASCTGTPRITDAQFARLKPGMRMNEVRAILGPPWKTVLHPGEPGKETHRYVMARRRERRLETIPGDRIGRTHWVDAGPVGDYREIELVFQDGKLVEGK